VASVSMSRRTIALVLAVALAALATIALISYVNGLEDKAFEGTEVVKVFVAKQDIAAGVSGDTASQQGLITETTVPAKVRPVSAITSLQEISGKIAAVQIFKDEVIVGARFVAPGAAVKGVLPIPQGRQAVSVQVASPAGVAGFIQPGDQVSLIAQIARTGAGAAGGNIAKFLLQRIDVLAVGTRVVSVGAAVQPAGAAQPAADVACCLLTLALTPGQAEQLVFASLNGQLHFTLLPEGSQPANTPGRNLTNLFN
jgi:pilus assembly protein CpaB